MQISSAKDLKVYQLAYELAMDIFLLSKGWPENERCSVDREMSGGGEDARRHAERSQTIHSEIGTGCSC